MYYYGRRYYDGENGRFPAVDPARGKYASWSPYVYTLDNPLKFIDPDGGEVQKIVINIENARGQVYSDINPVKDISVAVTDFSRFNGPTAGTTLYVKGTAWGPVSNLWQDAGTSWQQNQDNPSDVEPAWLPPVYVVLIHLPALNVAYISVTGQWKSFPASIRTSREIVIIMNHGENALRS